MVGISPSFFSVVDKIGWYINGWYITRFCLLWTVMVGISPSSFCRGQNWLVYQPD